MLTYLYSNDISIRYGHSLHPYCVQASSEGDGESADSYASSYLQVESAGNTCHCKNKCNLAPNLEAAELPLA